MKIMFYSGLQKTEVGGVVKWCSKMVEFVDLGVVGVQKYVIICGFLAKNRTKLTPVNLTYYKGLCYSYPYKGLSNYPKNRTKTEQI